MNSRVSPTYKTKYRGANRASCDRALVGRGDVTLWVSPKLHRNKVDAERPRESQTLKALLRRGAKSVTDTPVDVQMTRQFHFEEVELLIPLTFDATPEEEKE